MVNLRRSLNAERTEFAETFHAENAEPRRCAEAGHHSAAGGCRPPCVRHIDREAARKRKAASACFSVCVSVLPLDRCRAQRAPPAWVCVAFSLRDSAAQRPLREVFSARSAALGAMAR